MVIRLCLQAPALATKEITVSVRKLNGYWTVYSNEQPVLSFTSFAEALALMEQTIMEGV